MNESFDKELKDIDHSQLRKHNRYNITTACRVFNLESNIKIDTFLTTISIGGVSFVYPEIIPKGTIMRIEFAMPNRSNVDKFIEIKRFETEIKKFPSSTGAECLGFEHGSKFILLNQEKTEEPVRSKPEVPKIPKEEQMRNCSYHLEFYQNGSNNLKHGYVNKIGDKYISFHSLVDLQLGEIIFANIVMAEENNHVEKKVQIQIQENTKEAKLFSAKGLFFS